MNTYLKYKDPAHISIVSASVFSKIGLLGLILITFLGVLISTTRGGEVSNSRLWMSTALDSMSADGSENQIRFMVKSPQANGNITFYLSATNLPASQQGSVTITSSQLVFDQTMYAVYTAPTLSPTETLYGIQPVRIRLEWENLDTGGSSYVELWVAVNLGPKPSSGYKITQLRVLPSAQSALQARGLIPADTNCFACIEATVSGIPEGTTPTVRFDCLNTRNGAFVSTDPGFDFDRSYIEIYVSSAHPVAKAYYHNTRAEVSSYTDTIAASIAGSSSQAVVEVGLPLSIQKVNPVLYTSDEIKTQYGIHPYIRVDSHPGLDLKIYSDEFNSLWPVSPRHTGEYNTRLGASIRMERQNRTYYNYLSEAVAWGGSPDTYYGFTEFIRNGTNNMLEYTGQATLQPVYPWAEHWLPGVELTSDGLFLFLLQAEAVLQQGVITQQMAHATMTQKNAIFALTRDGPNSEIEDIFCAPAPQSVSWYLALELIKNFYKPADYALFFSDVLCKLLGNDIAGAILASTKQGMSFHAGQLEDMLTDGRITPAQLLELKALSATVSLWNYYDYGNNLYTLHTNSAGQVIAGQSTTDYTSWPEDYADVPDLTPLQQASVDLVIPARGTAAGDPEYQHRTTTAVSPWFTQPNGAPHDTLIMAAVGVESAQLRINGSTLAPTYDPGTFEPTSVQPAMMFMSNQTAVCYMPNTNAATLTLVCTNPAALTVIHPESQEYCLYQLPVLFPATGSVYFSAGSTKNPLSLHTKAGTVDIAPQTFSLTGTATIATIVEPDAAKDDGAAWRLQGGFGRKSGYPVQVSPGTHTVEYSRHNRWAAPGPSRTLAAIGTTNILFGLYAANNAVEMYDFSKTSDLSDWNSLSGNWGLIDQTYQMSGAQENIFALTTLRKQRKDYTFSADLRKVQGDTPSSAYTYGLLIRSNADGDHYYEFLITADGQYRIGRREGYDYTVLVDYTPSSALLTGYGVWNNLRVTARDTDLEFYINGQIVQTIEQTQILKGAPGLIAIDAAASSTPDTVQFNNIRLVQDTTPTLSPACLLLLEAM